MKKATRFKVKWRERLRSKKKNKMKSDGMLAFLKLGAWALKG